jgi:hypothetical protein
VLLANTLSWFYPTWLQAQADQGQAGDMRLLSTGNAGALTVVKPDGRRVSMTSQGPSAAFLDTTETGIYRVESGGETSEFAVNLASDSETDLSPRFSTPGLAPGEKDERQGVPMPVWPAVAAAALALLVLEWLAWVWRPGKAAAA